MPSVFHYSAIAELNWKKNLEEMGNFKPQYTFYSDFSIAEFCETYMRDRNAVRKTFKKVKREWGNNYKALTEIYMVLNHKIWAFAEKIDSKYMGCSDETADYFARLYNDLWEECGEFFNKIYKDNKEALDYFYSVTD